MTTKLLQQEDKAKPPSNQSFSVIAFSLFIMKIKHKFAILHI